MADIIYLDRFKKAVKQLLMGVPSEPEITLDMTQVLNLFGDSDICKNLRRLKPSANKMEMETLYGSDGFVSGLKFVVYDEDERSKYRKE